MAEFYHNIGIDRVNFKFTEDELTLYNNLYERYLKIVNKLDGICPEKFPEAYVINLIRIANIQRIVISTRSKKNIANLFIKNTKVNRAKVITSQKLSIEQNNYRPIHIAVQIPESHINIVGKVSLIEEINNDFSKYDCFNEFIDNNDKINDMNMHDIEEELTKEVPEVEYKYKKKPRYEEEEDYEKNIMRALANGDGDLYGF